MRIIRIGTRTSRLAWIQAELVKEKIEKCSRDIQVELVPVVTKGDRILDRSLDSFGGKGVFTKELEERLLNGTIDLAVHSAKDLPMELPDGLVIGAAAERANPADVLVTVNGRKLAELPAGSVIGTSSLRRELQLREINPGVRVKMLRGNVQTRLDKLKAGEYDGIVLAAAGLNRLGLELDGEFYWEYLASEDFLPAAGQGILAVECRKGECRDICGAIHSEKAGLMLTAEREFLKTVGGSCNAPAAALCTVEDGCIRMEGAYWKKTGDGYVKRRVLRERKLEADAVQRACAAGAWTGKKPGIAVPAGKGPETTAQTREKQAAGIQTAKELGAAVGAAVKDAKGCPGTVYLTGAGPGDMGLLSLRALECIRKADVVVYDHLIPIAALNETKPEAQLIYAGKRASSHHMKQEEINRLLAEEARKEKQVVRLKGGDPFVFGRGSEEAQALAGEGIPFEMIPGISSAYSVPEYAGIPVTERHLASSFHVITGQEGSHKEADVLNYEVLAREEGTLVFLMGQKHIGEIAVRLMDNGKPAKTPAAVIARGTTAGQQCVRARLDEIGKAAKSAALPTPAILVVGEAAGLGDTLSWFGRKPLSGKRILLTGTKALADKLAEELGREGMEAVPFSLIRTKERGGREKEEAYRKLSSYAWAVFTSASGVREFFRQLGERRIDRRSLSHLKFAVVGNGTGQALEEYGYYPDYTASRFTTADLAMELPSVIRESERVLLLRAEEASGELPRRLAEQGIAFSDIRIYGIEPDMRKGEELLRQLPKTDYVLFASPSAVRAFASMCGGDAGDGASSDRKARILCIGPVTESEAKRCGLSVYQTAREYSVRGICDMLLAQAEKERKEKG